MEMRRVSANLGSYEAAVGKAMKEFQADGIVGRIYARDHRVWKESPSEIVDRLGWLNPADMVEKIAGINDFVAAVRADGCRHALLLGMGGSSLAAEVFRNTIGVRKGYPDLAVLDSTDPGAVLHHAETLDPARTIFIVSTKSGGTVETFSFMKYFYNLCERILGKGQAGRNFVAVTDPGSALAELAAVHNFRAVFLNDPHIGGRYSALSYFGLVPAALMGIDIREFLKRAVSAAETEANETDGTSGACLGVILGELAKAGRDKLTLFISPRLAAFGVWLEQLIAESTGKEGKGILPVVGEAPREPSQYLSDRAFIFMNLRGESRDDNLARALEKNGHPVITLELDDIGDLGAHCFFWEMATAVAGARLSINPFDQPNVEAAKRLAREIIAKYKEGGLIPEETPALKANGLAVYGDFKAETPEGALESFLGRSESGAYAAIQAFVRPTPETDAALCELRRRIAGEFKIATTLGYGPRFLHSTGQLHKGDGGLGLFIQITADDERDAPIPDEMGKPFSSLTFGILKAAQAAGDRRALLAAGRRVMRFHMGNDPTGGLRKLL